MSKKPLKVISGTPDRPLIIGDIEIHCYVLEGETRVLVQKDLFSSVGISRAGPRIIGTKMPRFMTSKSINPFISKELRYGLENPILFSAGGGTSYGYPATILVDICNVIIDARDSNALRPSQLKIVQSCELLIRSIAKVGIIALVDEATGYQEIRAQRALATILEKFIAKELQPWTKTFPYEFYELLYKLRGWSGPDGHKRTHQVAHDTNDLIYERLAPGVLNDLRQKNPTVTTGRRKNRHHQWFTPEFGHPKLKEHLAAVIALMRASANWGRFTANLNRAFPKQNETLQLMLDDGDE